MQVEKQQNTGEVDWEFMMLAVRRRMVPQSTIREEDLMFCTRDQMETGSVLNLIILNGRVVSSKPLHFPTLVRSGHIRKVGEAG